MHRHAVDHVRYTDEIASVLSGKGPLHLMNGVNTDRYGGFGPLILFLAILNSLLDHELETR